MTRKLIKFLKSWFCHHRRLTFVRNAYVLQVLVSRRNELQMTGRYISIWKCYDCQKLIRQDILGYIYQGCETHSNCTLKYEAVGFRPVNEDD